MISLGLKTRFMLASCSLVAVLVGSFMLAIYQFVEYLEEDVFAHQFIAEFNRVARSWERAPDGLPELPPGFRAIIGPRQAVASLPPELRSLAPGVFPETIVDGEEYAVGHRVIAGTSLFVLHPTRLDPIERVERHLIEIAGLALLAASLAAIGLALWLARLVLRPVRALAHAAAAIQPGQPRLPLHDAGGDRDIGLIAEAFDRTLDRFDELVETERAFARDASHELRTPLAVILSGVELMESTAQRDPVLEHRLGRLRSAAEQMQALTEGLLFLARPDPSPPARPYPVSTVVQDAIRLQQLAGAPATHEIHLTVIDDVQLTAPRGLLLCVINNLMRNAIEHGGDCAVRVTLANRCLLVCDQGPGFSGIEPSAYFARHRRGETSGGEGLGLFIVKRICDRVGWPLTAESPPGGGARFELRFEHAGEVVPPR